MAKIAPMNWCSAEDSFPPVEAYLLPRTALRFYRKAQRRTPGRRANLQKRLPLSNSILQTALSVQSYLVKTN